MSLEDIISEKRISEFEDLISYRFKNRGYLVLALTHSSFANENRKNSMKSNERLEFLGDSVLNLVITEHLYYNCGQFSEGDLTKIRAGIVCEPSLMECAKKINLGEYLLLGKGEEQTGGRRRASILSDAFEALIGSVFLDGGLESAARFIKKHMSDIIDKGVKGQIQMDYKTYFQELIQRDSEKKVTYELIAENGPDHNKIFRSQVKVDDMVMGIGEGRSKKESEQNAARDALERMGM